eukprot:COSAG01_NODE_5967_length_3927_cov_4.567921_1_plen_106_part_10
MLFVTEGRHRYLPNLEEREEAGTPPPSSGRSAAAWSSSWPRYVGESQPSVIIGSLILSLAQAVGAERMHRLEQRALRRVGGRWRTQPLLELLGPPLPTMDSDGAAG